MGDTDSSLSLIQIVKKTTKPSEYLWAILGIVIGIVATIVSLVIPIYAKDIVNNLHGGVGIGNFYPIMFMFIVSVLLSIVSSVLLGLFGEHVVESIRNLIITKLLCFPISFYDDHNSGELSSHVLNDTSLVKEFLSEILPRFISSLLTVIGSLSIMVMMNWKMTLIIVLTVPISIFFIIPLGHLSNTIANRKQMKLAEVSGHLTNILNEPDLVKTSTAEHQERIYLGQLFHTLFQLGKKETIFDSIVGPVVSLVILFAFIGNLIYGIVQLTAGLLTVGAFLAFLIYLFQLIGPLSDIGQFFTEYSKIKGTTKILRQLLYEETEEVRDRTYDGEGRVLEFENVSFKYPHANRLILDNLTFSIKNKSTVAFVGPSGSGKTTIFKLIEQLYNPTLGKIKVGQTNIDAFDLQKWRYHIGVVNQNATLIDGTIRENIMYGIRENISDDQLSEIMDLANIKDFVNELPDGIDTNVGEEGSQLSGGERQRVAIAHALAKSPDMILLDEATSSLDSQSESNFQNTLDKLVDKKTILIIAHRLSTVVNADEIFVIDGGRIIASGRHEYLLEHSALYKEFVKQQMIK